MRIAVLATAFVTLALPIEARAQTDAAHPATLLGNDPAVGGYLALTTDIGSVKGKSAVFVGADLMVLLQHRIALGLGGAGLTTNNATVGSAGAEQEISLGYGGLMLGYVARPQALLHPRFGLLLGAGSVNAGDDPDGEGSDRVFVAVPSFELELSLTRAVRLSAGASYRHIGDCDLGGVSSSDLSGLNGRVSLSLGRF